MKHTRISSRTLTSWSVIITASVFLSGCEQGRLDNEVRQLCAQDGGVKVYETVILREMEYSQLQNSYGEFAIPFKNRARQNDPYYYEVDTKYLKKGNPEMWRSEYRLVRKSDGKALAVSVRYARRGGDMPGPWHESSFGCPDIKKGEQMADLVFKKVN